MIVKDIPIKEIERKYNIREKEPSTKDSAELMQSIKNTGGLLQPIGLKEKRVSKNGKKYEAIWGNRRIEAYEKLGNKEIPSVIFCNKNESMTEEEFVIINAIENQHQRPNSLLELGRAVDILREKNLSFQEISTRMAVSEARIKMEKSERLDIEDD